MRVVFMGTPEFAVPSLRALHSAGYEIVGVYTQPDRPSGRGKHVVRPPVKVAAENLGLPVFQPPSLRPSEEVARLADLRPELILVAAFGQLLRPSILEIPPLGILNVHASLLPRWRGAAPIAHAILAGDSETGVTIMRIDAGMDTGPTLVKEIVPIQDSDTTGSLSVKLAEVGATLLLKAIPAWVSGSLAAEPQNDVLATIARRITPADGDLDWSVSAEHLARVVRAMQPWPGAHTSWNGRRLEILAAKVGDSWAEEPRNPKEPPGTVTAHGRSGIAIATGDGVLIIDALQLEGSRPVDTPAFRAGHNAIIGCRLPS